MKLGSLDGSAVSREVIISEFQVDDKRREFLLSLKAGGVCFNRTAPNHVVHFDPWRDPAVENQELIEWAGNYDPDWFNIEEVNLRLQN